MTDYEENQAHAPKNCRRACGRRAERLGEIRAGERKEGGARPSDNDGRGERYPEAQCWQQSVFSPSYFLVYSDAPVQSLDVEPSEEQTLKANLAKAGAGKVLCRLCKGDHFTAKCPYKESLAGLDTTGE